MKGVTKWLIELVIGVIIILVLTPTIIKVSGSIWNQIAMKLGWVKLSPVEKAILCSYYRCVKGCADPEVTGQLGGKGWCMDFKHTACDLPEEAGAVGDNGKVCGWNAMQFPVETTTGEKSIISEKEIKELTEDLKKLRCIVLPNGLFTNGCGDWIVVHRDIINVFGEKVNQECKPLDGYKELDLKSKEKIYVTADQMTDPLGRHYWRIELMKAAPILLFDDEQGGGAVLGINQNIQDLSKYAIEGSKNNNWSGKISSVVFTPSSNIEKIILFDKKDYQGDNITLAGSSPTLSMIGKVPLSSSTIGKTSSIKLIGKNCNEGVTVYDKPGYNGKSETIKKNYTDLSKLPGGCHCNLRLPHGGKCLQYDWNDCIKSIKIPQGCKAILYEDPNYKGKYMILTGNNPTLDFNDKAKSVKIVYK